MGGKERDDLEIQLHDEPFSPPARKHARDTDARQRTPDTWSGPKIHMPPELRESIDRFAASDKTRELGGILVGRVFHGDDKGPGNTVISIEAMIPAKHAESSATTIKFTHETWSYVNRVKDEKYPDCKIVGWIHTHPGFGIFLSSYDLFIQNNFFNLPWQVAYVVDPVNDESGFFVNGHDGPVPAEAVSLWTTATGDRPSGKRHRGLAPGPAAESFPPVRSADPPAGPTARPPGGSPPASGRRRWPYYFLGAWIIVVLGLVYTGIHVWQLSRELQYTADELEQEMLMDRAAASSVAAVVKASYDTLTALEARVSALSTFVDTLDAAPPPSEEQAEIDLVQAVAEDATENLPPPPPALAPQPPSARGPEGVYYWTRAGDSLWSISVDVYGDGRLYHRIADANELHDPTIIPVDTALFVPGSEFLRLSLRGR